MQELTDLFVDVDDFFLEFQKVFASKLFQSRYRKVRQSRMSCSEVMTIVIMFHSSGFRTFKDFFLYLESHHKKDFPTLVSYTRFLELKQSSLLPLCAYLLKNLGTPTGISFIDSTKIVVCHNKRINRNRVFGSKAARGKSSMGWFFGFKLHLIVNDRGEILAVRLTKGNVDDRKPVEEMSSGIFGKLFGDKGYIGKDLFNSLFQKGLNLITNVRKNMRNRLLSVEDKILLRKRFIIETINDQLKNISQIEHTRHRSSANFLVNLMAGLISYSRQPKKPSLKFNRPEGTELAVF